MKIITLSGEVQLTKRYWWQLCKSGWYKHEDVFGRLWWIRFNWPSFPEICNKCGRRNFGWSQTCKCGELTHENGHQYKPYNKNLNQ